MDGTLCGVWIDGEGTARVCLATAEGGRAETTLPFEPFAWLPSAPVDEPVSGVTFDRLGGSASLGTLARARSLEAFDGFVRMARASISWSSPAGRPTHPG